MSVGQLGRLAVTPLGPAYAAPTAARASAAPNPTPTPPSPVVGDWTVMVYITGTDLNEYARDNIKQMERLAARLPGTVRITVLWDQAAGPDAKGKPIPYYSTGDGAQPAWTTVGYAVIQPDRTPNDFNVHTAFMVVPETDTGSAATLANFEVWSRNMAPARHYALILWDHGGGYTGLNFDKYDVLPPGNLTAQTTASALATAKAQGVNLDLLAADECLMATPEFLYSVRDLAPVLVASEEIIQGPGYDYATALGVLAWNPSRVTTLDLARSMVTSFHQQYVPQRTNYADTLSAVYAPYLQPIVNAVRGFVNATHAATPADWTAIDRARARATPYWGDEGMPLTPPFTNRDLGLFMQQVAASPQVSLPIRQAAAQVSWLIQGAVFAKTDGKRFASGLAIYLPDPKLPLDPSYATLVPDFNAQTGWFGFLTNLRAATQSRAVPSPAPFTFAAAGLRALRSV
jgi:hypothetical protein